LKANSAAGRTCRSAGSLGSGEVHEVLGDDRAGPGDNGSRGNVFIIRVGQTEGSFEGLPGRNFGVVEVLPLLADKVLRPSRGLRRCSATLHQLFNLVVLKLLEDCRAPHRAVNTLDGQGEQEVALQARPAVRRYRAAR